MTHVKLPAGYEDWVEVPRPISSLPQRPEHGRFLEVIWGIGDATRTGTSVVWKPGNTRYFVPPKPKPVLPEVKPGAVVRYTSKTGKPERAVRNFESWSVYGAGTSGRMNSAGDTGWSLEWSDADLLERVNADGFTVELEGL